MALHIFFWPTLTRPAGQPRKYSGDRHIFPIQVLSLQHEDSTPTEWLPYLGVIFSPVQVLEFWGRAAKRDPPCRSDEAVFYSWKERRELLCDTMSFANISVH